jgi:hypothetical protein
VVIGSVTVLLENRSRRLEGRLDGVVIILVQRVACPARTSVGFRGKAQFFGPVRNAEHDHRPGRPANELGIEALCCRAFHPGHLALHAGGEPFRQGAADARGRRGEADVVEAEFRQRGTQALAVDHG